MLLSIKRGIVQHMEDDVFWRADGTSFPVQLHLVADRRRRRAAGAPSSRSTTSPSASASRPSFSTWPTTTPSPASTTGAGSSRSSRVTSPTTRATARRRRAGARHRQLQATSTTRFGHKAGDEVITRVARAIREPDPRDRHVRAPGRRRVRDPPARGRHRTGAGRGAHDHRHRPRPAGLRRRPADPGDHQHRRDDVRRRREVDGESLLVEADLAMYDAKAAGRDTVRALHAGGGARGRDRVPARVGGPGPPRARRGAVHLYSQPVDLVETGETVQHELLLRLVDDEASSSCPGRSFPSAERFG